MHYWLDPINHFYTVLLTPSNHLKVVDLAVPERIQVDNGSEFISKALDLWAYENGVTLDFSRPGKPTARRPLTTRLLNHLTGVSGRPPRG